MIEEFKKFVSLYNLEDEKIKLKYEHSLEVMRLSEKYARILGFSDYDIELAKVIGLLHDYGRFDQWKNYGTFNDLKSIDHADYSVDLLFKDGFISKYWTCSDDYSLIEFAIKNHNKYEIEPCNNERFLMFAKLIRDVDKIDIMRVNTTYSIDIDKIDDYEISPYVMECISNEKSVKLNKNNYVDAIVARFAFVFDINNKICLKEMKDIYTIYYDKLNNKKFENVYLKVMDYIDKN